MPANDPILDVDSAEWVVKLSNQVRKLEAEKDSFGL